MKRLAVVLALAGCGSAQRHPAITAGIVGLAVGGLSCEIDSPDSQASCAIIGGSAAVFLGGIAALVTLFADTSDQSNQVFDDDDQGSASVRLHTSTPPPPVVVDAGVDAPPVIVDAPAVIDAAPAD